MSADLDKLKKLSIRLITERKVLIETLAVAPTAEQLSSESLRRLADVSAAGQLFRVRLQPMSRIWVGVPNSLQLCARAISYASSSA